MSESNATIHFTYTDEAPALASFSLLPILQAYCASSGVEFISKDISLAGRILAQFPDRLTQEQRIGDELTELGDLAKTPNANIIKLPNISASIPQLSDAIAELQAHGYAIPDFPDSPSTDEEKAIRAAYGVVLGSAVNPVLREGNSDRRVAAPVKEYAKANPHSMGAWSSDSKTHVAHMSSGDFFGSELSHTMASAGVVRIEHHADDGTITTLKDNISLEAGEVIDASAMSAAGLRTFLAEQLADAKANDVMVSLHVKATMMKISDPIIFGHMVSTYLKDVFDRHGETLAEAGVDPDNGIGAMLARIADLPAQSREPIERDIAACFENGPALAMVNSDKGITNLHVPSDVIIDASMPAAIRASGMMWGADGNLHDTKAIIPDRSYAGVFQKTIEFCQRHGAFDVTTMGNVSNVGLMAQKAEEYGSHDKTFELAGAGTVKVVGDDGQTIFEHTVGTGDIWRMCQTKDAPIRDWVKLAVSRARATGSPAVFWLNKERGHDAGLISKIEQYLPDHDTAGLEILVKSAEDATEYTLERIRAGKDTISVTGNVLRDYLTDLFPILELGTSAKMLSIVPLLAGGGLFETGAGGSAPKHVQQFLSEGHLRWDSLGEFLAIAVSLEDLGRKTGSDRIGVLAATLNEANGRYLNTDKSPSRKVNELDNRGSHFYLAMYWAEALAAQSDDAGLSAEFADLAKSLAANEDKIVGELAAAQGKSVELGGYFEPDAALAAQAMRPSATFNALLAASS
jgi:isocitrate dehydrogenase